MSESGNPAIPDSISASIERCLLKHAGNTRLWKQIKYHSGVPSITQLEHFKFSHSPVCISGGFEHWSKAWTVPYLRDKMGEEEVTISITPDGYADAIRDGIFMEPFQEKMKMRELLDWIESPTSRIHYAQLQNGSLNLEFSALGDDVDLDGLKWANDVFGRPTSNLWVGNSSSFTSLHHDPMENIYCVVKGTKKFRLFPPEQYVQLNERRVPKGRWSSDMTPIIESETIQWLDPPDLEAIEVDVHEGECLYLPALWFHSVAQVDNEEGIVIAVNYWYDIDYEGSKWRDWQLIRAMTLIAGGRADEAEAELD